VLIEHTDMQLFEKVILHAHRPRIAALAAVRDEAAVFRLDASDAVHGVPASVKAMQRETADFADERRLKFDAART
jgi:hypothetical protein